MQLREFLLEEDPNGCKSDHQWSEEEGDSEQDQLLPCRKIEGTGLLIPQPRTEVLQGSPQLGDFAYGYDGPHVTEGRRGMSSLGTVVELEAVHTCMHSNPVEFDGIENWIVEALPDAQEFYSAPVPKPVAKEICFYCSVKPGKDGAKARV